MFVELFLAENWCVFPTKSTTVRETKVKFDFSTKLRDPE